MISTTLGFRRFPGMPLRLGILLSLGSLLSTLPLLAAEAPRRLEPVDLVELEQPADPRISPDGSRVAYLVQSHLAEEGRGSALWLAEDAGKAGEAPSLRRITEPSSQSSRPRWSPGGSLAFIARSESGGRTLQAYDLRSGRISELAPEIDGVGDFAFSPDGSLAFLRRDPPTPGAREKIRRGDDARVVGDVPRHVRLWSLDVESGKLRALSGKDRTVWHFGFSPDGKRVAVLASESPIAEGHEYGSHLAVLDVATGKETILAPRAGAQANPSFSPDGAWVAYLAPLGTFKERGTIHVVPSTGGEPKPLLVDDPGNVWDVVWDPRKPRMWAGLARGAENHLAAVSLDGDVSIQVSPRHSLIPYWGPMFSLSADGEHVAFLGEGPRGKEVWISRGGEEPRRLTRFGEQLDGVALGTVETTRWKSATDGAVVEGILVHPPGAGERRATPLVVVLHGGPAYNWGLGSQLGRRAQLWASRGYRVLLPNFRGSSGYGMKWLTANVRDWGHGPTSDVLGGVDHLVAAGLADRERLFLDGGSYGGYLTFWILGQSDRFQAAFTRAGIADLATEYALTDEPSFLVGYFQADPYEDPEIYRLNSPLTYASRVKTPLLMVHGEEDLRVPVSESRRFHDAVRHHGGTSRLVLYPREGHGIREYSHRLDVMRRALVWFSQHGGPPP